MTTVPLGNQQTRQLPALPAASVRHGRAGSPRRATHTAARQLPRPTTRGVLTVAGLAQLAAAIGWMTGYGWSPAGGALAFNAAFLLLLAAVVRP